MESKSASTSSGWSSFSFCGGGGDEEGGGADGVSGDGVLGAGIWDIGSCFGDDSADGDNLEATAGGEGVADADDIFGSSAICSGVEDEVLQLLVVLFGWLGTGAVDSMGGGGGRAAIGDGGGCVGNGGGDGDRLAGGAAIGDGGGCVGNGGGGGDWQAIGVVVSICTILSATDCSASETGSVSVVDAPAANGGTRFPPLDVDASG